MRKKFMPPGRVIDELNLSQHLYRLLTAFLASPSVARLLNDDQYDTWAFQQLLDENEEKEIQQSLVYSAICLRMFDDLNRISKRSKAIGTIGILSESGATRQLSLRDACNKIIHADNIVYPTEQSEDVEYMQPSIELSGRMPGERRKWKATIDIRKYIEAAHLSAFF